MKIFVTAKPASREESVVQIDATHFAVKVKEPPQDGRANEAIVRAVAEFLDIAPSRIELKSGFNGKKKALEIC